jgi:hypothetical protein
MVCLVGSAQGERMNPAFAASIERQIAELTAVGTVPEEALGYGRDLSCVTDITQDAREVDPQSPLAVAEAVCRRFISPRGCLIEDPDYGLDLRAFCNHGITYIELRSLADQAQLEACKDDRVDSAEVTLDYDDVTKDLRLHVQLTCVDPALGIFSLVFFLPADAAPLLESINV